MDFAKQEITQIRALLIKTLPYQDTKTIALLFTREKGSISVIWYNSKTTKHLHFAPLGIKCSVQGTGGLYRAFDIECAHSFSQKSPHFPMLWCTIKLLIEETQNEQPTSALWDLLISTLAKESEFYDWKTPLIYACCAISETLGFSLQELISDEELPNEVLLNNDQLDSLVQIMNQTHNERKETKAEEGLLERLVRFLGIKTDSEKLKKYCERGDLNPHEVTLTTTSK